ncbi:NucA/NucB deoxyribonuclease domain-containing protein [Micromonospora rifamycinica]|uniref:NucA/NucB deoxyribonuclease domain-containing protein n=1 Tax=Micromonospora rifamycinica TaxID=291594 RepID=UPI0039A6E945
MRGSWSITSDTPGPSTPTSPGSSRLTSDQRLRLTLESPPPTVPGVATTTPLSTVRCDNSLGIGRISKGCVFPSVTPVFLLSGAESPLSPVHAAFVSSAQTSLPGHPGRVDRVPLHRLSNTAQRDANRALSCAGFVPIDSADSCDEYPFAATYEGGAGAIVAHVPRTDNTNGGSKLSGFFQKDRVLDGDAFFVQVVG